LINEHAAHLDTIAPVMLMPQVHNLLRQEQQLMQDGGSITTDLAAVACNTAIIAGWLSYNIHNRGDANSMWSYALDLAKESQRNQLHSYVLGIRSYLYSSVPRRGEAWGDASLPIELLDEAVKIDRGGASPALRAFLHARRAEEHAALNNRAGAFRDLHAAHTAIARQVPSGRRDDVPILTAWHEARLARYHGSTALLLGDYDEATQILRATLNRLGSFLPQRAMAMTDLATIYIKRQNPEPEAAASLLSEALDISEQGGLIEATMRVAEARRYLTRWHDEPFVRHLDEQLRLT
jgi:tetratricopeptide (TPR) repeat protein